MLALIPSTPPRKRKGSMGPPALPPTPRPTPGAGPAIDLRSPTPSPQSRARTSSVFSVSVKDEPDVKPDLRSPSSSPRGRLMSSSLGPRGPPTPSPSPSPRRRMRTSLFGASPTRSRSLSVRPSASPTPSFRSRRGSHAPSMASSISMDEVPDRRHIDLDTPDRDMRPGRRAPRVPKDTDAGNIPSTPAFRPMPAELQVAISELFAILNKWLPAADATPDFKAECFDIIATRLFSIEHFKAHNTEWLSESSIKISPSLIEELVAIQRRACRMLIKGEIGGYQVDGSKSKSMTTRQAEWYTEHQRFVVASCRDLQCDLPMQLARRIAAKLAAHWGGMLDDLQSDLQEHVEVIGKDDCFDVVEAIRRICQVTIAEGWATKVTKK